LGFGKGFFRHIDAMNFSDVAIKPPVHKTDAATNVKHSRGRWTPLAFQKVQKEFRFDLQEEVVGLSCYAKRILHQP
jgi:hypothetical protein